MSRRCIDGNCPRWNPCKEGECVERAASAPAMSTHGEDAMKESELKPSPAGLKAEAIAAGNVRVTGEPQ